MWRKQDTENNAQIFLEKDQHWATIENDRKQKLALR